MYRFSILIKKQSKISENASLTQKTQKTFSRRFDKKQLVDPKNF